MVRQQLRDALQLTVGRRVLFVQAAVVRDNGQMLGSLRNKSIQQDLGGTGAKESADCDHVAVFDGRYSLSSCYHFVFHKNLPLLIYKMFPRAGWFRPAERIDNRSYFLLTQPLATISCMT